VQRLLDCAIRPDADGNAVGVKDLIFPIQQGEFGFPIYWEDRSDLHDVPGSYRRGAGESWAAKDAAGRVVGTIGLCGIGGGAAPGAQGRGARRRMSRAAASSSRASQTRRRA
jgi:hypothetical protein